MENEILGNLSKIVESLNKLGVSTKNIHDLVEVLENLNQSCSELATTTSQLNSRDTLDYIDSFSGATSAIVSLKQEMENQKVATLAAKAATFAFQGAITLLSNPVGLAVGALGLLGGALALYNSFESDAEKETRLFIEAQEEKREELVKTSNAINESLAASVDNAKNAEIQTTVLKGYVDNLKKLADEDGYVKNFEEARYYVDQINSAMPGTVKLTKDGQLAWLQNAEAIDENIKQLERKAKIDAYYDGYVESLKNEARLRGELTLAQNNYNSALEKQQEYQAKFDELKEKALSGESYDYEKLTEYRLKLEEANETLGQCSETLDKANGAYEANAKGADMYNQAVRALDGSIADSALLLTDEYAVLEENGTSTWDSLAAASESCSSRISTAQGAELETVKLSSALIQAEMVNKALTQGLTYDQMISQLEEKGAQLDYKEKELLKESYDQWAMTTENIKSVQAKGLDTLKLMKMTALSNMNDSDKEKLQMCVKQFAEAGDKEGIELCNQLANSLERNDGVINKESTKIMNNIVEKAKNSNPTIKYFTDTVDAEETIKKFKENLSFSTSANVLVDLFARAGGKLIPFNKFAAGGFPETGELFLAREAGPELVGRIHGKTAVANNDQIVAGISSGVFNAMRSALQGNGSHGNMNLYATFMMDGEVVGKQVIKYHNGVVKRTGTTPLLI